MLSSHVTLNSILAAEEEVVVATKSGELIGVNWNATLDPGFRWEVSQGLDGFIVADIRYSSMIGGFSIVFENGRVAFMPIHYNPEEVSNPHSGSRSSITQRRSSTHTVSTRVQFVPDVDNGITSAINHKYQLIAFGLQKYVFH